MSPDFISLQGEKVDPFSNSGAFLSKPNETVTRRFQNSPKFAGKKAGMTDSEAEILLSIATGNGQQAMGERISTILSRLFDEEMSEYKISNLPFLEANYLSDLFSVLTKIVKRSQRNELESMGDFVLKFNTTDRIRLLNVSGDVMIGNQSLKSAIICILK